MNFPVLMKYDIPDDKILIVNFHSLITGVVIISNIRPVGECSATFIECDCDVWIPYFLCKHDMGA